MKVRRCLGCNHPTHEAGRCQTPPVITHLIPRVCACTYDGATYYPAGLPESMDTGSERAT